MTGRNSCAIEVVQRPHDSYVNPLEGGYSGYQAACWDCDWRGTEFLRGDEPMGTEASRQHKRNARAESIEHAETHQIECCSRCRRSLKELDDGV